MNLVIPGPDRDIIIPFRMTGGKLQLLQSFTRDVDSAESVEYSFWAFGIIELIVENTVLIRNVCTGFINEFDVYPPVSGISFEVYTKDLLRSQR